MMFQPRVKLKRVFSMRCKGREACNMLMDSIGDEFKQSELRCEFSKMTNAQQAPEPHA
jgi:hypothetical protein